MYRSHSASPLLPPVFNSLRPALYSASVTETSEGKPSEKERRGEEREKKGRKEARTSVDDNKSSG